MFLVVVPMVFGRFVMLHHQSHYFGVGITLVAFSFLCVCVGFGVERILDKAVNGITLSSRCLTEVPSLKLQPLMALAINILTVAPPVAAVLFLLSARTGMHLL